MSAIDNLKMIFPEMSQGYIDANHNKKMDDGEKIKSKKALPSLPEILEQIAITVRDPADIDRTITVLDEEGDRTNDLDLWDLMAKYKIRLMTIKDELKKASD